MPSSYKPGQNVPKSGQYQEIGPRGGNHGEVTLPKGKTFPPTDLPNSTFVLVDPTKTKP